MICLRDRERERVVERLGLTERSMLNTTHIA